LTGAYQLVDGQCVEIEVARAPGQTFAHALVEQCLVRASDPDIDGSMEPVAPRCIDAPFEFG
jgi:hypothetical protein